MLKTRVIPCLTIKDLRLVKSTQFAEHRNIGSYIAASRVFNARDVDEMIILDLDSSKDGIKPWLLEEIAKECLMPLTVGGGIKTIEDVRTMLKIGADKVSLNTAAFKNPDLINKAANIFGSQCLVISIDARKTINGYEVFIENGQFSTGVSPENWAKEIKKRGAGEIFLTSIDRDGMMTGYEMGLIKKVADLVSIPVIASGGAGKLDDFVDAIRKGNASALAALSIFQYTQTTPLNVKQYLSKFGIETRI